MHHHYPFQSASFLPQFRTYPTRNHTTEAIVLYCCQLLNPPPGPSDSAWLSLPFSTYCSTKMPTTYFMLSSDSVYCNLLGLVFLCLLSIMISLEEQSSAVEVCWAHNPGVNRSKPSSATGFSSWLLPQVFGTDGQDGLGGLFHH